MASGGGGGDTPYKGPIRRGSARKGIFFRLQVNEREGISLVEVYKNGRENCHFRQKWYIKGWTVEPYGIASPNKLCCAPPPPPLRVTSQVYENNNNLQKRYDIQTTQGLQIIQECNEQACTRKIAYVNSHKPLLLNSFITSQSACN